MVQAPFIERNNRTTIVAIFAIVVIVAVVATYLKVNAVSPFGDGGTAENRQGFGSFIGTLHGVLSDQEVFRGALTIQGVGTRTYEISLAERQLKVSADGNDVFVQLVPDEVVPQVLYGSYADAAGDIEIVVNGLTSSITLIGFFPYDPQAGIMLPLVPTAVSTATLQTPGGNIVVEYVWGAERVLLQTPTSSDTITLVPAGESLVGTWTYEGADHPVTIVGHAITIEEFY